jgi:hypothetical protein
MGFFNVCENELIQSKENQVQSLHLIILIQLEGLTSAPPLFILQGKIGFLKPHFWHFVLLLLLSRQWR